MSAVSSLCACATLAAGVSATYAPPATSSPMPSAAAPAIRRRNRVRGPLPASGRGVGGGGVVVVIGASSRPRRSADEVDDGEQADPDDVDEVPVIRHDDRRGGLLRGEL